MATNDSDPAGKSISPHTEHCKGDGASDPTKPPTPGSVLSEEWCQSPPTKQTKSWAWRSSMRVLDGNEHGTMVPLF